MDGITTSGWIRECTSSPICHWPQEDGSETSCFPSFDTPDQLERMYAAGVAQEHVARQRIGDLGRILGCPTTVAAGRGYEAFKCGVEPTLNPRRVVVPKD